MNIRIVLTLLLIVYYNCGFSQSYVLINGPKIFYFKSDKKFKRNAPILVFSNNHLLSNGDTLKSKKLSITITLKSNVTNVEIDSTLNLSNVVVVLSKSGKLNKIQNVIKKTLLIDSIQLIDSKLIGNFKIGLTDQNLDCISYALYRIPR